MKRKPGQDTPQYSSCRSIKDQEQMNKYFPFMMVVSIHRSATTATVPNFLFPFPIILTIPILAGEKLQYATTLSF